AASLCLILESWIDEDSCIRVRACRRNREPGSSIDDPVRDQRGFCNGPMTELAASAKQGPTPMRRPSLSQGALVALITVLAACPARAQHHAAASHAQGANVHAAPR